MSWSPTSLPNRVLERGGRPDVGGHRLGAHYMAQGLVVLTVGIGVAWLSCGAGSGSFRLTALSAPCRYQRERNSLAAQGVN
jgi:hypothetical protein